MSVPKTQNVWTVEGQNGFDSLKLNANASVPTPSDYEVLVKFHAASLNYRDLIIPKGMYPFAQKDGVVPGSDGAGEIVAVGPKVDRFKVGDNVITLFNRGHIGGSLNTKTIATGLGGVLDGTLRQYGTFPDSGLIPMPTNLTYAQASTLPCAALTAWNALYGLRALKPGDTVLTQGTGGVSLFAVQFAKIAGATVIATTSSASKAQKLKELGADHVLNYKDTTNWGEEARKITGGEGVDFVVEVGGPGTMEQSLKAVGIDGVITIVGFLGGVEKGKDGPGFLDCLNGVCTVRGVLVGSRGMGEEMCKAIERNGLVPVVDDGRKWGVGELKEAYQYMWDQKHFGKMVINLE